MINPVIGQEAICPGGLGRVVSFDFEPPNRNITVATYVKNNESIWDKDNVELIPIYPLKYIKSELVEVISELKDINKDLTTIIFQLDNIFKFVKEN